MRRPTRLISTAWPYVAKPLTTKTARTESATSSNWSLLFWVKTWSSTGSISFASAAVESATRTMKRSASASQPASGRTFSRSSLRNRGQLARPSLF